MKQYQKIRVREIAEGGTLGALNRLDSIIEELEEIKEQISNFEENATTENDSKYINKYYNDISGLQDKIYNIIDEYLKKGLEK